MALIKIIGKWEHLISIGGIRTISYSEERRGEDRRRKGGMEERYFAALVNSTIAL